MDLLVAILMALGAITSPGQFGDTNADIDQDMVRQANEILDTGGYTYDERGGVVITGNTGG